MKIVWFDAKKLGYTWSGIKKYTGPAVEIDIEKFSTLLSLVSYGPPYTYKVKQVYIISLTCDDIKFFECDDKNLIHIISNAITEAQYEKLKKFIGEA